jgi:prepilin-type N-terminal cleavage/methylation domain-containing protein
MTKHRLGFTLIELMVYMMILPILLYVLIQIFDSVLDVQMESMTSSSLQQDAGFILSRFEYDVHRATSITTPTAPGLTTNCPGLILGLIINSTAYNFTCSGENLYLNSQLLNSSEVLVSGLSVTRIGNDTGHDTVKISMDLTGSSLGLNGQTQSRSYQTTFGLR